MNISQYALGTHHGGVDEGISKASLKTRELGRMFGLLEMHEVVVEESEAWPRLQTASREDNQINTYCFLSLSQPCYMHCKD